MRKLKLDELNRLSKDEYRALKKIPVRIMLDNVRSLHNVGSSFRTADAFAIEGIYLSGITGTPPHREIQKTALGATESVMWEYCENPLETITKLKETGYSIVAVEQTDNSIDISVFSFEKEGKYLLVFGNEVEGVSDEILELCDISTDINQFGTKHSFNVSVSIGIILFAFSQFFRK